MLSDERIAKLLADSCAACPLWPEQFDVRIFARSIEREARQQALEDAALVCDSVDNYANPMTARDCADAIRALEWHS